LQWRKFVQKIKRTVNNDFCGQFPLNNRQGSTKMLGWNIPPIDEGLVHPHWRQYEAVPTETHLALAFIYFLLLIISVSGNGLVLLVFGT
jgi:hypothetical protein